MTRFRAYLQELREGVRLLPEMLRFIFSDKYWAAILQRYIDRLYTDRHYDEWAAWASDARDANRKKG